jgi:hypothetical protein
MVQNAKPDHPVSLKIAEGPRQPCKQRVLKVEVYVDGSGGSQDQTGPRGKTLANDRTEQDLEIGPERVAVKQEKAQGKKKEINTEAGSSFQQQQNQTFWFGKPEHLVSPGQVQKGTSRMTIPGTVPGPRWCPLGLTPNQRRRI